MSVGSRRDSEQKVGRVTLGLRAFQAFSGIDKIAHGLLHDG